MSNREIIEWLRKKAETVPMPGARKMYEAAVRAIDARDTQYNLPIGTDCISRQAAIDAMGRATWAINRINELPSAQPERRWIPCSERLPGDLSEVNVTWINHNPEPYFEFSKDKPFTATAVYYKDKWYWYSATCTDFLAEYGKCDWNEVDDAIEIVAWMPLPEPYRAERREE